MSASLPIDFFVVGAQKCATSWLYYCLREHPGLLLPSKKDEANYVGGARHREKGEDWLASLYPAGGAGLRRGSVSVDYLFDTAALQAVVARHPGARFIACLREPVARSLSAIQFLGRRGLVPAREPEEGLRSALAAFGSGDPARAAEAEVIARSLYARQLEPLLRTGAAGRLLVIGFECLRDRPRATLRAVYEFLGVAPEFVPPSFGERPKVNANLPWLVKLERMAPDSKLVAKVADHANRIAIKAGLGRPVAALSRELETQLQACFEPEVRRLETLLAAVPRPQQLFIDGPSRDWRRPV